LSAQSKSTQLVMAKSTVTLPKCFPGLRQWKCTRKALKF